MGSLIITYTVGPNSINQWVWNVPCEGSIKLRSRDTESDRGSVLQSWFHFFLAYQPLSPSAPEVVLWEHTGLGGRGWRRHWTSRGSVCAFLNPEQLYPWLWPLCPSPFPCPTLPCPWFQGGAPAIFCNSTLSSHWKLSKCLKIFCMPDPCLLTTFPPSLLLLHDFFMIQNVT